MKNFNNKLEEISLAFDKEISLSNVDKNESQKIYDDYLKIDTTLDKFFKNSIPNNLSNRIIEKVRREYQATHNAKPFKFLMYLRVAAIFIIFGTIGTIGTLILNDKDIKKLQPTLEKTNIKIPQKNVVNSDNIAIQQEEQSFIDIPKFSIPVNKLIPVSYGNVTGIILPPLNREKIKPILKVISDNVRHVWMVDDLNKALSQTIIIAEKLSIRIDFARNGNNTLDMASRMTKKQLVLFVKDLSKNNFKLLSSQTPQPEDMKLANKVDGLINYTWTVVAK